MSASRLIRRAPAVLVVPVLLAACATPPPPEPVSAEQRRETTATVTAVYPETRLIFMTSDDGRPLTIYAPEDVPNFESIEVGDRVTSTYYEAVAAEVTEAPPGGDEPVMISERGEEGALPGVGRGRLYTAVVTIESVDPARHIVRFNGPEGWPTEVTVRQPAVQEFIAQLEPGDRVMVTYGRAEAITIAPAAASPAAAPLAPAPTE